MLAEVSLRLEANREAATALSEARARPLDAGQQARAELVQALLWSAERRWADAAASFAHALPALDGRRRVTATYGLYIARAFADPRRNEAMPTGGALDDDPYGWLARALLEGYRGSPEDAIAILREAEKRFPDEPILPAARSRFALIIDAREESHEAAERALALDPGDPAALLSRAYYKGDVGYQLDAALADLMLAAASAPGDPDIWNAIGNVQSGRDANREAEQAFLNAIDADPSDPLPHVNYAILLLDQDRVEAAKREIDKAWALDPGFSFLYLAEGRYWLQRGDMPKAMQNLLASSVANPTQAQALLALAIGYYQDGDPEHAEQQLDAADRIDPNDPITPLARTIIALDAYDADEAIASARESVRRMQERGIYTSPLSESRQSGSTLGDAFRFLRLNAWGDYYSDAVADPTDASSYFDEAINGAANPFANQQDFGVTPEDTPFAANSVSSLMQGLLLDPLAVSGRNRHPDIVRRPFVDAAGGGGFATRDGEWVPTGDVEVQGFDNSVIPWAFYLDANNDAFDGGRPNDDAHATSAVAFLGAQPTPYDRFVGFAAYSEGKAALPGLISAPTSLDDNDVQSGRSIIGWSHTIGDRNVLSAAAGVTSDRNGFAFRSFFPFDASIDQDQVFAAASHLYGIGPLTFRYGIEGSVSETNRVLSDGTATLTEDVEIGEGRAYGDVLANVGPNLRLEAGAVGIAGDIDVDGVGADNPKRFSPRFGAELTPFDNHLLRAAYIETVEVPADFTLSPVTILGLSPNQVPVDFAAEVKTSTVRWDAEWTPRIFTSLDYQHQDLDNLSLTIPGTVATLDLPGGEIDRASATANLWIGGGLGAFASFAYADSEAGGGGSIPFLPETLGRIGLTWAHPSRVKVSITQSFVGERDGDLAGTGLDSYALTDASLNWEPLDRRIALDLGVFNIFDEDFEIATDVPGWGRTVAGRLTVRF